MQQDDLKQKDSERERLAKAKLALSGEEKISNWKEEADYLAKRKEEAMRALISPEQQKTLEEEEKLRRQRLESQKKLAELEEVRRQAEETKKQNFAEEQKQKDSLAEAERLAKITQIIESKQEIANVKKGISPGLTPIKTLTRDLGQAVKKEGLSISQISQNKRSDSARLAKISNPNKNKSWLIGLGLIFVLASLGLGLFVFNQKRLISRAPEIPTRPGLIFSNEQIAVNLSRQTRDSAWQIINEAIKTKNPNTDTLREIYFLKETEEDTNSGLKIKLSEMSISVFSDTLQFAWPDEFTRFLDTRFLFGFYYGTSQGPLYILKTQNYKNVADTLLKNEKEIITSALEPFITDEHLSQLNSNEFRDKMVNNYDTRLVLNEYNESIALYVWLDQETLLLTTDETIFTKILTHPLK